jgi:uncharacterized phage-associated protein
MDRLDSTMEAKMHPATMVANRLLELARAAGRTLTPMQLLKLVFLCHGWMLGLYNRALIQDEIQAWKFGPVIPELYRAVRQYRNLPVTHPVSRRPYDFDPIEDDLIRQVFGVYGHYSGPALSNITHEPGSPWDQVWDASERNVEIPDETIEAYYEGLAQRAAS